MPSSTGVRLNVVPYARSVCPREVDDLIGGLPASDAGAEDSLVPKGDHTDCGAGLLLDLILTCHA